MNAVVQKSLVRLIERLYQLPIVTILDIDDILGIRRIPFEEFITKPYERVTIDVLRQPFAGPIGTQNRVLVGFTSTGESECTIGRIISNQILPPE